jgi:hypothetical protein
MTEKTLPIKYENKINRRGYNPYVLEYKYSDENKDLRKEKIILEDKCMNIEQVFISENNKNGYFKIEFVKITNEVEEIVNHFQFLTSDRNIYRDIFNNGLRFLYL